MTNPLIFDYIRDDLGRAIAYPCMHLDGAKVWVDMKHDPKYTPLATTSEETPYPWKNHTAPATVIKEYDNYILLEIEPHVNPDHFLSKPTKPYKECIHKSDILDQTAHIGFRDPKDYANYKFLYGGSEW